MMDIAYEKSRARLQAKARRHAAHKQGSAAAIELIAHLPPSVFRSAVIGGYWPLAEELDPRPLLRALSDMGAVLALPCTPRKGYPLVFRHWTPADILRAGPYNTREPYPEQRVIYPDFVLVPLLAFTEAGERLGYGGGFYDRTLAALKQRHDVFACGVAYDAQKAARLPVGAYDIRLDGLLTETGFRKVS